MYVATLIAAKGLDDSLLREIAHQFDMDLSAGRLIGLEWVEEDEAADLVFEMDSPPEQVNGPMLADWLQGNAVSVAMRGYGRSLAVDIIVQPLAHRAKRLLVADMDSTMIQCECIDELADFAGLKAEVAAITEAAMRGELDFAAALDARVALLAGLDAGVIDRCLAERVRATPGAETLVRTMRARGARTVLVSGGFTRFAEPVGARLGFDRVIANALPIEDGRLTGAVKKPIVDAGTKLATLEAEMTALGIERAATLAVGDGANDLPMIQAAGLGVAYRAKPVVAAAAGARIEQGDLTALLWAQGIPRAEWVTG